VVHWYIAVLSFWRASNVDAAIAIAILSVRPFVRHINEPRLEGNIKILFAPHDTLMLEECCSTEYDVMVLLPQFNSWLVPKRSITEAKLEHHNVVVPNNPECLRLKCGCRLWLWSELTKKTRAISAIAFVSFVLQPSAVQLARTVEHVSTRTLLTTSTVAVARQVVAVISAKSVCVLTQSSSIVWWQSTHPQMNSLELVRISLSK